MSTQAPPVGRKSLLDSVAVVVGSGLGLGYSPLAPGTFGSALGVGLFWLARNWPPWAHMAAITLLFLGGTAAAGRLARMLGKKDPGRVVIDEVAGMWVSLVLLPFGARTALLAFVAFRIADVVKPWPARQMEDIPGGWGIMADDMMAGVYANLMVRVALLVWPLS